MSTYLEVYTQAINPSAGSQRTTKGLNVSIAGYQLMRSGLATLDLCLRAWRARRARQSTLRALSTLDEHTLNDIGVRRPYLNEALANTTRVAPEVSYRSGGYLVA